jgi:pimeloyl-ACP methyl ester carboxylesterase
MRKVLFLTTLAVFTSWSISVSAQINKDKLEVPMLVTGGSEAGKIGADSKLCDEQKKCDVLNYRERAVQLKLVSPAKNTTEKSKTWIITHGWNDNSEAADKDNKPRDMNLLAQEIASKNPNDNVIMLDWSQASNNTSERAIGPIDRGNYYAATWIRPVAEKVVERLRELGIDDAIASQKLNLVGHSLGSIMSAEIGSIYKDSQLQNQLIQKEDKIGVNSITALDPASEFNSNDSLLGLFGDLGGYDVDGRTPAYRKEKKLVPAPLFPRLPATMVDENGMPMTEIEQPLEMLPKENVDRPKDFRAAARNSRAFVGAKSFAGNQSLAATAHESFQMDFGNVIDNVIGELEHNRVVKTFTKLIQDQPFGGYWGINDWSSHYNVSPDHYDYGHEGIMAVNGNNVVSSISISHKKEGEVNIGRDGIAFKPETGNRIPIIGDLLTGLSRFISIPVGEIGSADQLFPSDRSRETDAMLVYNSCIAQVASSHIGSASCSFKTPNQPIQVESQAQNFASRGTGESIQQANQYTNGQIVRVPLDVGLTWNQDTKLDLDSHLATPNSEHIYFVNRGKLNETPNAFLYRDSIPDGGLKGAEQTRITQFQNGEYRFYVYNFSEGGSQGYTSNSLSNSNATVKLYEGGDPLTNVPNDPAVFDLNNPNVQKVGAPYPGDSTFKVPVNQVGNTWYVFKLNTRTGILYRVDRFGNSPDSSSVPTIR